MTSHGFISFGNFEICIPNLLLENLVCAICRSDKDIDGFKPTPAGREAFMTWPKEKVSFFHWAAYTLIMYL